MEKMEKIVSLCKRRGFIFQGSEIYGGLSGMWDYGPLGVALRDKITALWWKHFVLDREDMYGIDAALIMNPVVWKASGHVDGFSDPLVECDKCKRRFRADQIKDLKICSECGGKLSEPRQFNMMFKTFIGASEDEAGTVYLRPETAQGMFVNFKNILDTFHPKLPFGMAQMGKAFRNEISPRDFLFRVREFEQMEIEYFIRESEWEKYFEYWRSEMKKWIADIGLKSSNIHELEVPEGERAHYSKRTIDFEYTFPFGRKELYGLAYRTDFDLKSHQTTSGVSLEYYDPSVDGQAGGGERFIPHVIEPTFGIGRTILAVLCESYDEDELGGETRAVLRLPKNLAPVSVAVFPLLKNKEGLVSKAREIYKMLKKESISVTFDDNGNIGKRYRRQDEIGTPYCVTVDFETLENDTVTIRDRDTGEQKRVKAGEIISAIR
ncbi:MAG: glycine--tRNA ligase [Candidatus Zambryskibacteria bacterium RIFCSPHIGHO2_01_FULL_43_25]|uniref:Glycine--tRNA ligase n=1 Tax=Candidatus Zambryskibacteria bacterium RIFCSPLOWO2_01_FULL_45_21 TaxID=1802761 RepID=A0A1G2U4D6_9BACT|nr:MAG: glycine--tRNA ligase [Candidatus Zambryskibacteria bacterium RIFCSPHIGHO2_01_FULL_43_25]OHB00909.1 MAG: glycine--tRNA ligase [Candidatus Zambryskibacteria bacterium RIFCSPHIGHO2_12_FULL_44_12b]OHB04387.1 MAG: glycine--tRNA ligase [Candidatus Zambryskibacteria bacterium RIFCSPLOWO2_01_FULL_45_21]